MSQPSITKICLKITCLKFHSNFRGANELLQFYGKLSKCLHHPRLMCTLLSGKLSSENNRACHPGGHYWDYYPRDVFKSSLCSSLDQQHRFRMQVPYFQKSRRDLTWQVFSLVVPVIATRATFPVNIVLCAMVVKKSETQTGLEPHQLGLHLYWNHGKSS